MSKSAGPPPGSAPRPASASTLCRALCRSSGAGTPATSKLIPAAGRGCPPPPAPTGTPADHKDIPSVPAAWPAPAPWPSPHQVTDAPQPDLLPRYEALAVAGADQAAPVRVARFDFLVKRRTRALGAAL